MPERRLGIALAAIGAVLTAAGAALYVLPGPGVPVLFLGLAALAIGLVTAAVDRRNRCRRPDVTKAPSPPRSGAGPVFPSSPSPLLPAGPPLSTGRFGRPSRVRRPPPAPSCGAAPATTRSRES
ncbi:PGPGW domain-containing protein [Streptomyces sp. 11x1]|uniref:PGPGW domain-containing protein n=1 Tax=Streptomyces sp. 11x1 TaxID=3038642 RepID=UPI00292D70FA|nr:PGPGW domain-containing protein [Streptomyces sp. 11x1]WNZ10156.1 PGPGW domain-containing protein [Streptomyces sp. 11x1]